MLYGIYKYLIEGMFQIELPYRILCISFKILLFVKIKVHTAIPLHTCIKFYQQICDAKYNAYQMRPNAVAI